MFACMPTRSRLASTQRRSNSRCSLKFTDSARLLTLRLRVSRCSSHIDDWTRVHIDRLSDSRRSLIYQRWNTRSQVMCPDSCSSLMPMARILLLTQTGGGDLIHAAVYQRHLLTQTGNLIHAAVECLLLNNTSSHRQALGFMLQSDAHKWKTRVGTAMLLFMLQSTACY